MANLNIFVEQQFYDKFKELKTLLKCKTNQETLNKLIIMAQDYLQQQLLNSMKPASNNQHHKIPQQKP